MKYCLNCQKPFENKKDTAKYCSDSCRVMYNRKHGGKKIKDWQKDVVYNKMVELNEKLMEQIEKLAFPPIVPPSNYTQGIVPIVSDKPKQTIRRSFDNFQQLRKACETEDQWEELKSEIMNCDYLSEKQIIFLTS